MKTDMNHAHQAHAHAHGHGGPGDEIRAALHPVEAPGHDAEFKPCYDLSVLLELDDHARSAVTGIRALDVFIAVANPVFVEVARACEQGEIVTRRPRRDVAGDGFEARVRLRE